MQVKDTAAHAWWSEFRKRAVGLALMMMLAVFSGCATTATTAPVTQQPLAPQRPSVARLEDGRQGFVIRETPGMDAESRSDFERAVGMMTDGKNDAAIELLTKVIERSPDVTAPYIDIAIGSGAWFIFTAMSSAMFPQPGFVM